MTEEERIKVIEDLELKSDELGIVPIDTGEIFKEYVSSTIDDAVKSLDKEENQKKLEELIRISDESDVIYVKILHDIIANCDDFHTKEFLEDVLEEFGDYSGSKDAEINYGGGPLEYIEGFIDQPLEEFSKKYIPYLPFFKEEYEKFQQKRDEYEERDEELSEDDYEKDPYHNVFDFQWDDRDLAFSLCVEDIQNFYEPAGERWYAIEYVDADTLLYDACNEIDKYLDENFDKVITLTSDDFEKLVDEIAKKDAFKNASDYVRREGMQEIIKYVSNHNLKIEKNEEVLPEIPEVSTKEDLEEIEEEVVFKQR